MRQLNRALFCGNDGQAASRCGFVGTVPAILTRLSFSGELGYEIYVEPEYHEFGGSSVYYPPNCPAL